MFVGRSQVGIADDAQDQGAADPSAGGLLESASSTAYGGGFDANAGGLNLNIESSGLNNLRIDSQDEIDMAIQATLQKHREDREVLKAYGDENLGENFEETPWVPPSLEVAWEYRLSTIFRSGQAKLSSLKITKAADLGSGMQLYFQFLKSMSILFFLCAICSAPSILFSFLGSRTPSSDRDIIGLYQFMIGNIGYDIESPTYYQDAACSSVVMPNITDGLTLFANQTCIDVFGVEVTMAQVADIITISEILQFLMFIIVVFHLSRRTTQLHTKADVNICTITDFAVVVEGLPQVVRHDELLKFFSELYPLDKPDWKERPPVSGCATVENVENTGNPVYRGTWIAELQIFHKMGAFIQAFKEKQALTQKLLRSRAMIKMYSTGTCRPSGPNESRRKTWENRMNTFGSEMENLTMKVMNETRNDMIYTKDAFDREAADAENGADQKPVTGSGKAAEDTFQMSSSVVCAFVVFNHCESKARCIEDFNKYSHFPFSMVYPPQLKFKGHKLRIRRAPEPDEILWENLEISKPQQFLRMSYTTVVAFILLAVGFMITLQASLYKQEFNDQIPKFSYCDSEVPALFSKSYTNIPSNPSFKRPFGAELNGTSLEALDAACEGVAVNTFYAKLYDEDDNTIGTYDLESCRYNASTFTGLCPSYEDSIFCPCLSTSSSESCQTLSYDAPYPGKEASTFPALTMGSCYCFDQLLDILQNSGIMSIYGDLAGQEVQCQSFAVNYLFAISLTLVASLSTVLINRALKAVLKSLAINERHHTVDSEQGAIMLKIFIATYINMAFVALLAFGRNDGLPSWAKRLQILQGEHPDFDIGWYPLVGSYMLLTFLFEIVSPIASVLLKAYVFYPFRRMWVHPSVEKMTSDKIAMQEDLNALEVGSVFDCSTHTAKLLALLFFAMTYAAAIPILMPLLALTFCLFFYVDRLLLCRFYQKPPNLGDASMRTILSVLPLAAGFRLLLAIWMLSNESVLPDGSLSAEQVPQIVLDNIPQIEMILDIYNEFVDSLQNRDVVIASLGTRITRPTIVPLCAMLALIVVYVLAKFIWPKLPIAWFIASFRKMLTGLSKRSKVHADARGFIYNIDLLRLKDPLRTESSPFTGEYYKIIDYGSQKCCFSHKDEITKEDTEAGWKGLYRDGLLTKCKTFLKATLTTTGTTRNAGAIKQTYEVISDHAVATYEISKIPTYRTAILALQETMDLILQDEMDPNINWNHHNSKTGSSALGLNKMEAYEKNRKERIVANQKMKKEEWEEKIKQRRSTNPETQAKAMALNRDLNAAMQADENDYNEAMEGDEEEDPYVDNVLNNVRAHAAQSAGDREMQYKV